MKYELRLIFLPGVTMLHVLRTLGIYLGSKLTSFVEWPEQCNLCSVTGTSLWLLILDTCPSQKLTGKGSLDKDMEQCNYRRKGLAEADQGMLSNLLCANKKQIAPIWKTECHPSSSTANFSFVWWTYSRITKLTWFVCPRRITIESYGSDDK